MYDSLKTYIKFQSDFSDFFNSTKGLIQGASLFTIFCSLFIFFGFENKLINGCSVPLYIEL